jgi:DNA mismatch repair protein MSH5
MLLAPTSSPRSVQGNSGAHGARRGSRRAIHTSSELPASSRESEDDEAALDALAEVVMAVDMRERGSVGCCYYVAKEEKLYCIEDVKFGGVEVIDACKLSLPLLTLFVD